MRIRPTVNNSATPTEVSVIDADKVGGFAASMTPGASQIPVKNGSNNLILPTGNVGIGTTNPTSKLHVVGVTATIQVTDGYNYGNIVTHSTGVNGGYLATGVNTNNIPYIQGGNNLGPVNLLINPNGGNVLVGTATDNGTGAKLQVNGGLAIGSDGIVITERIGGGAATLPAAPVGYFPIYLGGSLRYIAYYQ